MLYSGKFAEFEAQNRHIINFISEDDISFAGEKEKAIERIYTYMKETGADYMEEEDMP